MIIYPLGVYAFGIILKYLTIQLFTTNNGRYTHSQNGKYSSAYLRYKIYIYIMPKTVSCHCRYTSIMNIDCSCTRIGSEVHTCTASSPHISKKNWFHKLICMIQIVIRKISWFSTIHKIFLTLNYFQSICQYLIIICC